MSSNTYPKVSIRTLDLKGGANSQVQITTQYNPKELSFTKAVNWSDMGTVGTDYPSISFEKGNAIDLSVELFFDEYETGGDVRDQVRKIVQLCQINECGSGSDIAKRPPKVELLWGDGDALGIGKKFQGVMTSAQTKYTMFLSSGIPCRASVTVTIKQADAVGYKTESKEGSSTIMTFDNAQQIASTPGALEALEDQGKRVEDLKFPVSVKIDESSNKADA